jgi:hypothetical protein
LIISVDVFGILLKSLSNWKCVNVSNLMCEPGQLSRYSDSLRAEIPEEARSSVSVQSGPGAHPASYAMGKGLFAGARGGRAVALTTQPI